MLNVKFQIIKKKKLNILKQNIKLNKYINKNVNILNLIKFQNIKLKQIN